MTSIQEPDRDWTLDAFGGPLVIGDTVVYAGKDWRDGLTLNWGTVDAIKPGKVRIVRQARSAWLNFGGGAKVEEKPRRVWVELYKVAVVTRQPKAVA